MATGNQSFTGTTDDDVFIGAAGVDTVTTNTGTDVILTHSGDDAITIDGTGNKTIDGGAGTDSLTINHGSYGIDDFAVTYSGGYFQFTDPASSVVSFKNIETLSVGGVSYKLIYKGADGSTSVNTYVAYSDPATHTVSRAENLTAYDNNMISSALYNASSGIVKMFNFTSTEGSNLTLAGTLGAFGASTSDDLTITGTANNDTVSDRRGGWTGDLNISTGSGIDIIAITTSTGADTVDAGAGNDFVYVSQAYTSDTSLSGGAGVGVSFENPEYTGEVSGVGTLRILEAMALEMTL